MVALRPLRCPAWVIANQHIQRQCQISPLIAEIARIDGLARAQAYCFAIIQGELRAAFADPSGIETFAEIILQVHCSAPIACKAESCC